LLARSLEIKELPQTKSVALENVICIAMIEMYANLGLCMNHFKGEPTQAAELV
jgi:hypothetical protein